MVLSAEFMVVRVRVQIHPTQGSRGGGDPLPILQSFCHCDLRYGGRIESDDVASFKYRYRFWKLYQSLSFKSFRYNNDRKTRDCRSALQGCTESKTKFVQISIRLEGEECNDTRKFFENIAEKAIDIVKFIYFLS